MLTSEKNKNTRKIAQQFWVLACYERPPRNTRQRNPEPSLKTFMLTSEKTKIPANCAAILGFSLL
jgi:hypothetical protein